MKDLERAFEVSFAFLLQKKNNVILLFGELKLLFGAITHT